MSSAVHPDSGGWLRSRRFDAFFIGGIAFVALASGAIIAARPELFLMIFLADLWLLGYHHVVSTFTRRFTSGVDPNHRFLSTLSQPRRVWLYLLVCVGISTAFYTVAVRTADAFALMPYMVVFYQAINIHHYLVDAKIWKLRKQTVSAHVGIA
jgi:hypothetical protein